MLEIPEIFSPAYYDLIDRFVQGLGLGNFRSPHFGTGRQLIQKLRQELPEIWSEADCGIADLLASFSAASHPQEQDSAVSLLRVRLGNQCKNCDPKLDQYTVRIFVDSYMGEAELNADQRNVYIAFKTILDSPSTGKALAAKRQDSIMPIISIAGGAQLSVLAGARYEGYREAHSSVLQLEEQFRKVLYHRKYRWVFAQPNSVIPDLDSQDIAASRRIPALLCARDTPAIFWKPTHDGLSGAQLSSGSLLDPDSLMHRPPPGRWYAPVPDPFSKKP